MRDGVSASDRQCGEGHSECRLRLSLLSGAGTGVRQKLIRFANLPPGIFKMAAIQRRWRHGM
jgi:hypothetical protein